MLSRPTRRSAERRWWHAAVVGYWYEGTRRFPIYLACDGLTPYEGAAMRFDTAEDAWRRLAHAYAWHLASGEDMGQGQDVEDYDPGVIRIR